MFRKIFKNYIFLKSIILFTIFPLIGYLASVIISPVYESKVIFITENAVNTPTSLTNLASIAGINLQQDNDLQIRSNIYPLIINDINFKRKVLKMKIELNETYMSFLKEKYNLDQKLEINKIKNNLIDDSLYISLAEKNFINVLKNKYYIDIDEFNSYVTITAKSEDPNIAYLLTEFIFENLQDEVMDMYLENKKEILNLNTINLEEKKEEYEQYQKELSLFKDQNINIASNLYLSELTKIENKVNLSYNVYLNLSNLHEQLKIDISKYSPIFTIVQRPHVPYKKSFPNSLIFISFSFFIGLIFVLFYNYYSNVEFKKYLIKQIKI